MNICDKCETVSHCTANGCIPLTECINSGQVSAAQVVAHQEAGELPAAWVDPDDLVEVIVGQHPFGTAGVFWTRKQAKDISAIPLYTAAQLQVASREAMQKLAAERAEMTRIREALSDARNYIEATTLNASSRQTRDNYRGCLYRIDAAMGNNQEEIEHE